MCRPCMHRCMDAGSLHERLAILKVRNYRYITRLPLHRMLHASANIQHTCMRPGHGLARSLANTAIEVCVPNTARVVADDVAALSLLYAAFLAAIIAMASCKAILAPNLQIQIRHRAS